MRSSIIAVVVIATLTLAACGKGGKASKINEGSLEKAKALVHAPQPLADIKPKLVELLGEPTATEGEDLIWAGVSGDECHHMVLVVQGGEVKGTGGGMANAIVESEFAKCKARAGK